MEDFEKLSLKKVDVVGNIVGKFSTFSIHQEYRNDTDTVLEVTYTFPISATATVTGFIAKVGGKIIRGIVKEKEEAQKEYEKAMVRGDSAYMMRNDESNIFRMNIGKIATGETVVVQIDYIDNFEIVDNQIRMIIPTLVPPRYKSVATSGLDYAKNEVEYRGNLTVHLDKDLKIDDVASKTHGFKLENNTITAKDIKLDKDFVLDIKLAEQSFSKGYYQVLPSGNKVVYLSFFPDIETEETPAPKDYIFVIDISGSMEGYKMEQTKEAVIKCLKQLREGDKFNIIIFDNSIELFSEKIMEFNPENFEKAKKYVQALEARGGTELFSAIYTAIERFGKLNKIIFLFTDGEVGNESEIAKYVRQNIGKHLLFVFGIDSSVNKKGLQEIADAGRGKAEFIVRDENIKEIIVRQFARVSSSNLFEIVLNPKSNKVAYKIDKQRMLFNHEFYDVLVEVDAIVDDFELQCRTKSQTYLFTLSKDALEHSVLPLNKIYASEQIKQVEKYIEAHRYDENKGYKELIVQIAVTHQIDSKYTAFIAVNEREDKLTDIPDLQDTVLESPSGWDMGVARDRHYCKRPRYCDDGVYYRESMPASSNIPRSPKRTSPVSRIFNSIYMSDIFNEGSIFKEDEVEEKLSKKMEVLFQKIKVCEKMIVKKEAFQTVLDEIIEYFKLHFSPHSADHKKLIEKMKKETPRVYAYVKPVIEQSN